MTKRLKWTMSNYKIDSMGIQEVGVNWHNFKMSNTLASLLRQGFDLIRLVNTFNKLDTKNIGNFQRSGTATVIQDILVTYVKNAGIDHTHLGRWLWC